MSVAAIICEYNPFHNGHQYHINKIREDLGIDTVVIGIMSGNYTQRGEMAIADKAVRARCAVDCGMNLVIELPFPYSMSSAEIFARSAVHIIESLNVADYLSFGSENGNIEALSEISELMLSDKYNNALDSIVKESTKSGIGYPEMVETAIKKCGCTSRIEFSPNNILALEYLKALKTSGSTIKPHTVKRLGADYNSEQITNSNSYESATAIRNEIRQKNISALEYIPKQAKNNILNEIKIGAFPCDAEKISSAIISSLRLNSPSSECNIHDCGGGLYNRLIEKSFEANDINTLLRLCETKAYTNARLRRAIMYSFLGVTSSDVKSTPMFTQILAFDEKGQALLKKIKKRSTISILTKPSASKNIPEEAARQKELSDKADSIFQLTKPIPPDGNFALRFTPYVKK